jgi:small subunit ribosomal protein S20
LPQHKSAIKAVKTSEKARQRNRRVKSMIRSTLAQFKDTKEKTADNLKVVNKVLDKAAARGVIHKNKAARIKSQMARLTSGKKTS